MNSVPTVEWLKQYYVVDKMTVREICEIYKVGHRKVSKWLAEAGIEPNMPSPTKGLVLGRQTGTTKMCSRCLLDKPLEEFHKKADGAMGVRSVCKSCRIIENEENFEERTERNRRRHQADPSIRRSHLLKQNFHMTLEGYQDKFDKQGGLCMICGKAETATRDGKVLALAVDHDRSCCPGSRSCGKCVRDLLCSRCNMGIGHLDDDPDRMVLAAEYVKRHKRDRSVDASVAL